jgi:hypothetical protein
MHKASERRCGKQRGANNLSTYEWQVAVLSHRRGHEESLRLQLARRARLYTTQVGVIDRNAMHESVLGCETHSRSMCTGGDESTGSRQGYAYMSDESPRQPRQNRYESVTCARPCALTLPLKL